MQIEHVPLLQIARDLHDIPRGMDRFNAYLKTIMNADADDVEFVPLVAMNPMGREHVSARIDEWIALDADTIASEIVQIGAELPTQHAFKHGLVVIDDVRGGWTNRYTVDGWTRLVNPNAYTKRPWLTTVLYVSEPAWLDTLRQSIQSVVYRTDYVFQHGMARTLRGFLQQEGKTARFAGVSYPLDADDLDYTRYVITPLLDTDTDVYPVILAALYGDTAANTLGYPPLGLSDNAGLALALADYSG